MNALLTPLIESPQLMQCIDELQEIAQAERARREQFYEDISPEDKWEFINGEVIMHSPAKLKHIVIVKRISSLLDVFVETRGLGLVVTEKSMISLTRNDYEPDIIYFPEPLAGTLDPDQWKFPAPALIVEVLSRSTADRDRGVKFQDYAAHGVAEYWLVDPDEKSIEQYALTGALYTLSASRRTGTITSEAIRGFQMPIRAAFDSKARMKALREILAGG